MRRHRRDVDRAVDLRSYFEHHRPAHDPHAALVRHVDVALRVFRPRQLLLEAVEPEAVADALLENSARRVVAFDDKHVLRARVLRRAGRRKPGGTRAHDENVHCVRIAVPGSQPTVPRLPRALRRGLARKKERLRRKA